jgi:CheY-like chemotaxis protein
MKQAALKALVVDDNLRWLKTLTRLVQDMGYSISTAQSYAEALLAVEKKQAPPDLIVTDIRLRDGDESNIEGLLLLQEVHKRGQLRASIVVTGYPSPETRHIAEQLGAVYLEKGSFTREDFRREMEGIRRKSSANSSPHLQFRACLALATF